MDSKGVNISPLKASSALMLPSLQAPIHGYKTVRRAPSVAPSSAKLYIYIYIYLRQSRESKVRRVFTKCLIKTEQHLWYSL